jgi:Uma2 family endonuclease
MTAAKKIEPVSVEDYLAGELLAERKHEYMAGRVYMMAGAKNVHNTVAMDFCGLVHAQLRKRRCQVFNSDTKVRVRLATHTRFYYPDGMVVCEPNPPGDTFQDRPVAIAEVISEGTRRIDEGEKREAYLDIPTLSAYLLIETRAPRVVLLRRTEAGGFAEELYEGKDAVIPLDAINVSLPLAELYERVDFSAAAAVAAGEDDGAVDE